MIRWMDDGDDFFWNDSMINIKTIQQKTISEF